MESNIQLDLSQQILVGKMYNPVHEIGLFSNRILDMEVTVKSSEDIETFARGIWPRDLGALERFLALYFNRANKLAGWFWVSKGGTAGTVVDLKIISKIAIDLLSSSVIVCHNHPSGKLVPSTADCNVTTKISTALDTLDIKLLDHVILGEEAYYSFADEGIMPK